MLAYDTFQLMQAGYQHRGIRKEGLRDSLPWLTLCTSHNGFTMDGALMGVGSHNP